MTAVVEAVADTRKAPTPPETLHIRCCKPAEPKGLCRTGKPGTGNYRPFDNPDACPVCTALWLGGHKLGCPRDGDSFPWNRR
jgi:hypothetical protein